MQSGLAYIPLYSPVPTSRTASRTLPSDPPSASCHSPATSSSFGSNSFLERSQSEDNLSIGNSNSSSYCMLSQQRISSAGRMLSTCTPIAPSKLPTKQLKSCGQVLTSADYMQKMEEKEQSQNAKKGEKLKKCSIW